MRIVKNVTLDADGNRYVEIFGTSSESKPAQGICMGSCYIFLTPFPSQLIPKEFYMKLLSTNHPEKRGRCLTLTRNNK